MTDDSLASQRNFRLLTGMAHVCRDYPPPALRRLLRRQTLGVATLCLLLSCLGATAAEPTRRAIATTSESPAVAPLAGIDIALDVRHDILATEKGDEAAYQMLAQEFARDPRPHVKARYGEYLIEGKRWSAPEGRDAEGLALVNDALRAGSVHALRVIGWQLIAGTHGPADSVGGLGMLHQAAALGNMNAVVTLGDAYFRGIGTRQNLDLAETWFRQAANNGKPHSLFRLGQHYETQPEGLSRACQLYYEAAVRGSRSSVRRIKELVAQNVSAAQRAQRLVTLWFGGLGAPLERRETREAMAYLEATCPEDAEALLAIGRMHVASVNAKLAVPYFDKAIRLGSQDARAERARLLAEGHGLRMDQPAALAELRTLETERNPEAMALLGYYQYWGSLTGAGLKKDPAQAFAYSKRAADLGNFFGQRNVATCYEFGIGVPVDLALAARYYRAAEWRGDQMAQERGRRALRHVK